MSVHVLLPSLSRFAYPLLLTTLVFPFAGCTEAEPQATASKDKSKSAPSAQGSETTIESTSAESAELAADKCETATSPALATEPPTVYEISKAIDLRKWPRLEVVKSYDQQVGSMYYVAKSDLETASSFYEKLFTDAGWKPSQEMGGKIVNEFSSQMSLEKDGYLAFFSLSNDEENPGQINITLQTFPNIDARKLPRPEGCESVYDSQNSSMLVTEAPVKEVAAAIRDLVNEAGWTEHNYMQSSTPEMAVVNFVKNGVDLLAYISVAPAQGGKTSVQYAFTIMAHDVPIPPSAKDVNLTSSSPELQCLAPQDMEATAKFYHDAYAEVGYEAVDRLSRTGDEESALVFQTASDSAAVKSVILVELTARDGGTAVHLQPLSDEDIDPKGELADSLSDPTKEKMLEEEALDLDGIEPVGNLDINQEEMSEAEEFPRHPAVVRTFGDNDGSVKSLALSPDGKVVATGGYSFVAYNAESGEPIEGPEPFSDTNATTFSPDGKLLALGLSNGGLMVWDMNANEMPYELEGGDYSIERLSFSPNGKILALADTDGDLTLLNAKEGELIETRHVHEGRFNGLAFSPDGKQIATARSHVRIWDVESGEQLAEFRDPEGAIIGDIAFSPDGKFVAVAGFDTTLEVWDATEGKRTVLMEDHNDPVAAVAYSPDGELLASGSWGLDVVLWDATTGERLRVLTGHAQSINDLEFSTDGSQLASGADDGLVRLWDVQTALEHPDAEDAVPDLAGSPYSQEFEAEEFEEMAEEGQEEALREEIAEAEEVEGLPLPPNSQGTSSVGTMFSKTIETSVRSDLPDVMAFYVSELVDRGFLPDDAGETSDEKAVMKFSSDEELLTLTLEKFGAETRIKMDLKRPAAAESMGILPEEGKARVIVGNQLDSAVTVAIGKIELKAGPQEGLEKPDGPTTNLEPGKYTVKLIVEGKEPFEEPLEVEAGQTWGVMALPDGPFVIQIY